MLQFCKVLALWNAIQFGSVLGWALVTGHDLAGAGASLVIVLSVWIHENL